MLAFRGGTYDGSVTMNLSSTLVLLAHAFVVWLLCFATIGIAMKVTAERRALIIHAIAAPVFAAGASAVYFTWFAVATPLVAAAIFVGFIMVMDFVLVALVILRSLDMFRSALGTWLPFLLIFSAALLTGLLLDRR
jgi:hypothetical protein